MSQAAVERRVGAPARPGSMWWTLVGVCLGMFMLLLDITIVTVALPDIQRGLGSSFSGLQWIVDAYALTLAAFLLTAWCTSRDNPRIRALDEVAGSMITPPSATSAPHASHSASG